MTMPVSGSLARWILGSVCIGLAAHGSTALAYSCTAPSTGSVFNLSLCVEGEFQSAGSSSLQDIVDLISVDELRRRFPGYDADTSAGGFLLDVRGLPATISYERNSTALLFTVPSLGINRTFDGGTRDASNALLRAYLSQNAEEFLQELAVVSAVDPMGAGPASLQGAMVASDFAAGVDPVYDTLKPGSSFGLGARFGNYSMGDTAQNVFTLPIDYTYTFSNYDKLIIRAPLTYMDIDGADAYRGNVGLSYKKNVFRRWALTPSVGYGITGSADLGSRGHILSGSLTSDLMLYDSGPYQLSMGNLAGYYLTMPVRVGDIDVDYDLQNTILRNGLLFSMPLGTQIWGRQFSVDIYVTDTRFYGDDVYSDNYQEIGVSVGPMRSADKLAPNIASHPIGVGLKYIQGAGDIQGVELNFGYRF
jgi:hypothetical protein